jgi:divalent metal cation (Fe/Co/Zn/Cd) transporter
VPSRASKKVIYSAIVANLVIAIAEYVAAFATGSSAMLAEALPSSGDTGNEPLLLLGMKRSARPPDSLHPFGHGKVLYSYSLLVAIYIQDRIRQQEPAIKKIFIEPESPSTERGSISGVA